MCEQLYLTLFFMTVVHLRTLISQVLHMRPIFSQTMLININKKLIFALTSSKKKSIMLMLFCSILYVFFISTKYCSLYHQLFVILKTNNDKRIMCYVFLKCSSVYKQYVYHGFLTQNVDIESSFMPKEVTVGQFDIDHFLLSQVCHKLYHDCICVYVTH